VAIFARAFFISVGRSVAGRRSGVRRRLLTLVAVATPLVAFLLAVSPAGAVVSEPVAGTKVGLQKHSSLLLEASDEPKNFGNPSGNPVLHGSVTYAIYWDPTKSLYHGDWQHLINGFFEKLGAASGSLDSVFAVDTQYTDKSNQPAFYRSTFRGAYTDTIEYPPAGCTDPNPMEAGDAVTCLTDKQIHEQIEAFISTHGLQKGMGSLFYLLTPPGVTVCLDAGLSATHCSSNSASPNSFCSYHSDVSPTSPVSGDGNTILYAVIPWTAGGLANNHLRPGDQKPAFDCQDGGFDPSSKPVSERKEKAKEKNAKEETEFTEADTEEKEKIEKVRALEGPHQQEPNQQPCPNTDGSCDLGLADLIINQIGVEQQNIVTDPLLNAWQDPSKNESTDECRNVFGLVSGGGVTANEQSGAGTLFNQVLNGGDYYVNDAFNFAATKLDYPGVPCLTGAALAPQFTAPNPVNAGDIVAFDGMESDIALNAGTNFPGGGSAQPNYATYTWNFGDETASVSGFAPGAPPCTAPWLSPCAASVFHSFQYGGTYNVTLTVTDVGGNTASTTHEITVAGPPRPTKEQTKEPSSGGAVQVTQAAASASSGGTGAGGPKATVNPAATASIVSKSLRNVLRSGLVVRYSVNERVTGHFEVLLATSVARRIGLHGSPATGLAKGTPPQTIIGRAILVTTTGGHNTVKIQFSKATSARLRRLHNASVMLRLIVRNASAGSTTVLSTIALSG
jgi:hypothetical protein